jgi:hypothetical protein
MAELEGFSERFELPNIPQGPGVCIIEDEQGRVLKVVMSSSIRRRIGQLLDAKPGGTCVHGPKVYNAQRKGQRILVRWKLTPGYKAGKRRLIDELGPLWDS